MRHFGNQGVTEGALPEHVAGVDMLFGLELLSGNQSLYLELLRKFLVGHKDTTTAIRRALAADEWDIAKLMVHNTKGVSGCIGAIDVHHCAAALEQAIMTQSFELDTLLHQFEAALSEVMNELETKLPSAPTPLPVTA